MAMFRSTWTGNRLFSAGCPVRLLWQNRISDENKNREGSGEEKAWFIGVPGAGSGKALPDSSGRKVSHLYGEPRSTKFTKPWAPNGPFAGWEMPVWYSSVVEEHLATGRRPDCSTSRTWVLPD